LVKAPKKRCNLPSEYQTPKGRATRRGTSARALHDVDEILPAKERGAKARILFRESGRPEKAILGVSAYKMLSSGRKVGR